MNLKKFSGALNSAMELSARVLQGRPLSDELVKEFAQELNRNIKKIYTDHGIEQSFEITEQFANHVITHMIDSGVITFAPADYSHFDDFKAVDPEAHSPVLQDDMDNYDPKGLTFKEIDAGQTVEAAYQEKSDKDYIYVEFYDIVYTDVHSSYKKTKAEFKFIGLEAAREFVRLNGYGTSIEAQYFEISAFEPVTTYKRVKLQ